MILIVGGGVYWWSDSRISEVKRNAATTVVNAVALTLSEQIDLLNRTLNKMAQDPEVLIAVTSTNPVLLITVAEKLEKYFPDALKIRLLLPGVSQLDEKTAPRMGFADLDMVRETLTNNQPPGIQGYAGADRHLAITRRIVVNNQVVGVILASLNYDFFNKSIEAAAVKDGYIELRQAKLVLGSSGNQVDAGQSESLQTKVAGTDWDIYYYYASGVDSAKIILMTSAIFISLLLTILASFIGYLRISGLIAQDLNMVSTAFEDMMTRKPLGSYPVNLTETRAVISALVKFKQVHVHQNDKAIVNDSGILELDERITEKRPFKGLVTDTDYVIKEPKNTSNKS
jgi:phosphomannomutase/phosphoglucomutase